MDVLTVVGMLTSFLAIMIGQLFEGGTVQSLLNFSALLIVLGGTIGAVMVQTPSVLSKEPLIFCRGSLNHRCLILNPAATKCLNWPEKHVNWDFCLWKSIWKLKKIP